MNNEQLTDLCIQNGKNISAQSESLKSAHKRIDENDRMIESIYKLAANVEALALQVKLLTESMENNIARLEAGQKAQGERIGAIEKEPAAKWKALVAQIISLAVAAVVGGVISKFVN